MTSQYFHLPNSYKSHTLISISRLTTKYFTERYHRMQTVGCSNSSFDRRGSLKQLATTILHVVTELA